MVSETYLDSNNIIDDILKWSHANKIYNIDEIFAYSKLNCSIFYEFLSYDYNFDMVHAYLAYDDFLHFCDGCECYLIYECQHCSRS